MNYFKKVGLVLAAMLVPCVASAHEAYVLTHEEFEEGLMQQGVHILQSLKGVHNQTVFFGVAIATVVVFWIWAALLKFQHFKKLDLRLKSLRDYGLLAVRISVAIALLCSAYTNTFLGPELSLTSFTYAPYLKIVLYILSVMIGFGIWANVAGVVSIVLFGWSVGLFQAYMLTYVNYLGEFIALMVFGSGMYSLDHYWRNIKKHIAYGKEIALIRISYGLALVYTAINVKILHPALTMMVIEKYHLTKYWWLFPNDPLLVVLGAAIGELIIGICIALGFHTRLMVILSVIVITLSLCFFRESVWPHILLYGISILLFFDDGKYKVIKD